MSLILRGRDVAKMVKSYGVAEVCSHLKQAFEAKEIGKNDWSIQDLCVNLVAEGDGYNWLRSLDERRKGGYSVQEAAVVNTSAFSNITGQLLFSTIKEAMENPQFIGDDLVTRMPSQFQDSEKVPGISPVSDEFANEIAEGQQYPYVGLSEEFVTIGRAEKHGGILAITREALVGDRTGVLVRRAESIGQGAGIQREKAILDVVIGAVNPYSRNGTATNTYLTSGAYVNAQTNAMVDWSDFDNSMQLFAAVTDPNTGEPIVGTLDTVVCGVALLYTARRIINATEVRSGDITSGAGVQTISSNPVSSYQIKSNAWVTSRLSAAGLNSDDWFAINKAAFVWKEIWPLVVEREAAGSPAEFDTDVPVRFKVSYKGVPGVMEPRLAQKNTSS